MVRSMGWAAVAVSVLILLVFTVIRLTDMTAGSPSADAFEIRYVRNPEIALLHIIPGMVFLILAPLQFIKRIRQRHLNFHRWLGRVLATCAAISGIFALIAGFRFPAFGGILTLSATVFFGVLMLFSLGMAIRHILRKEVRRHREWMIRTFAIALGVASIRIFIGALTGFFDLDFEAVFGISFWLGLGVNLMIAEAWIRYTRRNRAFASERL